MKDLLQRYGYTYDGNCHCDGFQTDKYKNGDYQLRIRTRKDQYKIKKCGRSITLWVDIKTMEETLKNIHSNVAIQA